MKTAMRQLQLMAQAYQRMLKLNRMIANLARSEAITQAHPAEAVYHHHKAMLLSP